jgi:hypothetical protein
MLIEPPAVDLARGDACCHKSAQNHNMFAK